MYPSSSSVRTRRRQGGGEIPTRLASSTLVIRPSAWISPRILRSISSRFLDTRVRFPGAGSAGRQNVATLLAQPVQDAQFYCACSAPLTSFPRKIRRFGLQFLHSYPDVLDLDLTLLAPPRCLFRPLPAQVLTKVP